jgi:hypothetical protein
MSVEYLATLGFVLFVTTQTIVCLRLRTCAQVVRSSDGVIVFSGGSAGVSGATLCGAPDEVFMLTLFDSFGDGKLQCVPGC